MLVSLLLSFATLKEFHWQPGKFVKKEYISAVNVMLLKCNYVNNMRQCNFATTLRISDYIQILYDLHYFNKINRPCVQNMVLNI